MPVVMNRQRYLFVTNKSLFLKSFILIIILGGIDRRRWSGWPGWYCNAIMLLHLTEKGDINRSRKMFEPPDH